MNESGAGRVVVCRVGEERFVLPVAAVREVVASTPVTRLPGAPALVRGLANVHGTLVTTISGPRLLALEVPESGDWLVVLTLHQGRVGIQVDEVEDVVESEDWRVLDVDQLIAPLIADS